MSISQLPVEKPESSKVSITLEEYSTLKDDLKSLQDLVAVLSSQLTEARTEIADLRKSQTQFEATVNSKLVKATNASEHLTLTINGIKQTSNEDVRGIVNKVISAKIPGFNLNSETEVKRLESKSERHHSILIRVKKTNAQFDSWKSVQGSSLSGRDAGFNCERVYINESNSSESYKLYKKAKVLKSYGIKYVWIRNSRVLIRRVESGKVERIKNEMHINRILDTCGSN